MKLKLYNSGSILAPLKCGTRFLDEVFGEECGETTLEASRYNLFSKTIEVIVIREPFGHLASALHTELLDEWNFNPECTDEGIKGILKKFMVHNDNTTIDGGTHWSGDLYPNLYFYWRRNKSKMEVVDLKDLSSYLKSKGFEIPVYNSEKYEFKNYEYWCSKEEVLHFVKSNYPSIWENYTKQIEKSKLYYDYLINFTFFVN